MKKILVLAYAISPTRGSEFSVGWNYVLNMSKYYELHVIYGCSGTNIGDTVEMENYIKSAALLNVYFYPIKADRTISILNYLNKRGVLSYSFYLAFRYWHRLAYKKAERIVKEENISLVHYITPIGYREPGLLWKLGKPYVWGPVGGTCNIDYRLFCFLGFKSKIKFALRTIINLMQLNFSRRLRKAVEASDTVLGCTTETCSDLEKKVKKRILYLPENAITAQPFDYSKEKFAFKDGKVHFIWVGRIDAAKALTILIQALPLIRYRNDLLIHIVGDGPLKFNMQELACKLEVSECIEWHGFVPRIEVLDLMKASHVHLMTSLKEANSTVLFEAMSLGLPTITLDLCGMHDVVEDNTGIKIGISNGKQQILADYAAAIDCFVDKRDKLLNISEVVRASCEQLLWEKRCIFLCQVYDKILNKK